MKIKELSLLVSIQYTSWPPRRPMPLRRQHCCCGCGITMLEWCCVPRMTRENLAGSEMSKLLSFGYLNTTPQSSIVSRKSSADTRYQPSSAGTQAAYGNDRTMTGYRANRQPAAGTLPSSDTSPSLQPAATTWVYLSFINHCSATENHALSRYFVKPATANTTSIGHFITHSLIWLCICKLKQHCF